MPHHVTIHESEPFPICRKCESKVRYFRSEKQAHELPALLASPIVEDPDLNAA